MEVCEGGIYYRTEGITKSYLKDISYQIIGAAIEVHKNIGPGLLESVYHSCFVDEMISKGLFVKSQVHVPVFYKGKDLGGILKLDMLVNDQIIVVIKSVETIIPLYQAQLLSYLKLSQKPKGLLINFNSVNIKDQLVALVTDEYSKIPY